MAQGGSARPSVALRVGLNAAGVSVRALGSDRYLLADALANSVFAMRPGLRRATERNFRAAFPGLHHRAARRLAQRSFREYGRTSIDFLYAHHLPRSRVLSELHLVGADEHVLRGQRLGQPGILVTIHQGSWDVPATLAAAYGVDLTAVMDDGGSARLAELVTWARAEIGIRAVPASRSLRTLVRQLRSGNWLALLIDIPGDTPSVEVPFLGHRARFSSAAPVLAARTGAPLVPATCVRNPGGGYLVEIHPPVEVEPGADPEEALLPILPIFEAAIRRWPEQWFPFAEDRFIDLD